jgi:hypothetical protein
MAKNDLINNLPKSLKNNYAAINIEITIYTYVV